MTNELEKQFFDTFGIKPKYETHSCDGWGRTVEVKYFTDKKEADKFGMVLSELEYPQITDRILLELICILLSNNSPYMFKLGDWDVEKLKDTVLAMCIKLPDFLEWENTDDDNFKHQVQALFEEG